MAITGFALLHNIISPPARQTPAPVVEGPDYNTPPSRQQPAPTKLIRVDAASFLAEYRADERAASAQYRDRRIAVTGTLTGVFVPSFETSMRMAGKGLGAYAFVTMGGPRPSSVQETLFIPGISAYTEDSSFFGYESPTALNLRAGETVTLICTVGGAFLESGVHYSVTLSACKLAVPDTTAPTAVESGKSTTTESGYMTLYEKELESAGEQQ